MKKIKIWAVCLVIITGAGTMLTSFTTNHDTGGKGCDVYGKIKFVDYGQDYKVKLVDYGEDVKIKYVDYSEQQKGRWKKVDYGEDYKIKIVDYGEDFKVKIVDYGEGC